MVEASGDKAHGSEWEASMNSLFVEIYRRMTLIEQNDDWLVTRRYLSEDSMAELLTTRTGREDEIEKDLQSRKELQAA